MATMDENARLEYAALMERSRDAERMTLVCWMAAGLASAILLAWGMGTRQPGFMLPVVLAVAWGFLAMSRWREQAMVLAGYLETYHESENQDPSYHTRLGRLQGTASNAAGRDWHATMFFNLVAVAAAAFAWTVAAKPSHGELWAGVVTGCTLAFVSYSVSETARLQQMDPAALWQRAEGGMKEVRRRAAGR